MARLYEHYKTKVRPKLAETLNIKNQMAIPKLVKIVVSMCIGKATENKQLLEMASKDIQTITGQKPLYTRIRKAVASYHTRIGMKIGVKVTLRGIRMYEFLDRLVSIALPRIRDFRGLPYSGFDSAGNYTIGIKEQSVFPEIDVSKIESVTGMNVTLCSKFIKKEHSVELLKALGLPFERN